MRLKKLSPEKYKLLLEKLRSRTLTSDDLTKSELKSFLSQIPREEVNVNLVQVVADKKLYSGVEKILDFVLTDGKQENTSWVYMRRWFKYVFPKVKVINTGGTIHHWDIEDIIDDTIVSLFMQNNYDSKKANGKASSYILRTLAKRSQIKLTEYYVDRNLVISDSDITSSDENDLEVDQLVSGVSGSLSFSDIEVEEERKTIGCYFLVKIARKIIEIINREFKLNGKLSDLSFVQKEYNEYKTLMYIFMRDSDKGRHFSEIRVKFFLSVLQNAYSPEELKELEQILGKYNETQRKLAISIMNAIKTGTEFFLPPLNNRKKYSISSYIKELNAIILPLRAELREYLKKNGIKKAHFSGYDIKVRIYTYGNSYRIVVHPRYESEFWGFVESSYDFPLHIVLKFQQLLRLELSKRLIIKKSPKSI